MDEILIALAAQHAELAGIVDRCTDDDWERPNALRRVGRRFVLLHLAETDEFAAMTTRGDLDQFRDGFLGNRENQTISVDDAAAARSICDPR